MSLIIENISLTDPMYKDEIASIILNLQEKEIILSLRSILDEMTDFIVNTYNTGEQIEKFKSDWINRIKSTADLLNIQLMNGYPKWDKILCKIINRKPCIPSQSNLEIMSVSTKRINTNILSSGFVLNDAEKSRIKEMYASLDKSKMWILSTGRRVEEVMEAFALNCNYEHLACSLILDTDDEHWCSWFTNSELEEICTLNSKQSQDISEEMNSFLESIPNSTSTEEIFEYLNQQIINPNDKRSLYWAKSSLINAADMFNTKYLPATDLSEDDLLQRMWCFIDNAFDTSNIKSRSEKSCFSSMKMENKKRKISAEERTKRKECGERPNFLFFCSKYDLGYGEIGKLESNHTKEMNDGSIKLPKILKAMLLILLNCGVNIGQDLYTIGVVISGSSLLLKFLDNPGGYVCRVKPVKQYYFPEMSEEFLKRMIPLIIQV